MVPVLDTSGTPFRLVADHIGDEANWKMIGQFFAYPPDYHDRDKRGKVYERRLRNDPVTASPKVDAAGRPYFSLHDVYCKPDGNLFTIPNEENQNEQTISRWSQIGNGKQQDLYLEKGFRLAEPQDVIRQRDKGRLNAEAADRRAALLDPEKRDERLAELLAAAVEGRKDRTATMAVNVALANKLEQEAKQPQKGGGR